MTVDEALLLRVGIDTGTGGAHGPLFPDGRFEYVPIPESTGTAERRTYADSSDATARRSRRTSPPR